MKTITLENSSTAVVTVTLNRPTQHNALDDVLISELTETLESLQTSSTLRVLILKGTGPSFCAGADLHWMQKTATYSHQENNQEALKLSALLKALYAFPKPTVAVAHGSVFGGGNGLLACCNIVLCAEKTRFSFSEVKLGLIPAMISPYVLRAIGLRQAERFFLTGELFDAHQAHSMGLVHEIAPENDLENTLNRTIKALLKTGPQASIQTKILLSEKEALDISPTRQQKLAELIATCRASEEAQEGLTSFFEKRSPQWVKEDL